MDKRLLSERDICTKFITPAVKRAGWDEMTQVREEVGFTKGRIIVRGKLVTRGKPKRADYVLYYKPNLPLAVIEAKDNTHSVGDGIQQALGYAETLGIPFVFSSNGDAFLFHDRTGTGDAVETELALDDFPSPQELWSRYRTWKGLDADQEALVLQDYFDDGSGKEPRYYQRIAINRTIEAIAKGQNRVLLVMATGTGKTYTAFQIIWRLWKAGRKKRILFLADRNVLIDQTMVNDFRPFGPAMAKLSTGTKTIERDDGAAVALPAAIDRKRRIDTSFEVYLGLYQAITGPEERQKLFREFSPGFFDLIVIDGLPWGEGGWPKDEPKGAVGASGRASGLPTAPISPFFCWTPECGRCPMRGQESRTRSRTTRSTLIWEISDENCGAKCLIVPSGRVVDCRSRAGCPGRRRLRRHRSESEGWRRSGHGGDDGTIQPGRLLPGAVGGVRSG
jgi:hypothetical protein